MLFADKRQYGDILRRINTYALESLSIWMRTQSKTHPLKREEYRLEWGFEYLLFSSVRILQPQIHFSVVDSSGASEFQMFPAC